MIFSMDMEISHELGWSKFNPGWALMTLLERMFDDVHFGHQVGVFDQSVWGIPPGDHQVQLGRFVFFQPGESLLSVSSQPKCSG